MSKRICGKCKSTKVVDLPSYAGSSFYKCETCGKMGMQENFPEMTVFDRITASEEVLAPHFIIKHHKDSETQYYISILNNTIYSKYEIALEATLAKLKEVEG